MSSYPCILVYAWIDGVLLGSCRCSVPVREHRRALRNEHTGNRRVAGLMDKTKRNPAMFRRYNYILLLLPAQVMLYYYYCDLSFQNFQSAHITQQFPRFRVAPPSSCALPPKPCTALGREPNSVHGPCHRPADRERILSLCARGEQRAPCGMSKAVC